MPLVPFLKNAEVLVARGRGAATLEDLWQGNRSETCHVDTSLLWCFICSCTNNGETWISRTTLPYITSEFSLEVMY